MDYVDIFDGDVFDGEILVVNGNIYIILERFEFFFVFIYYVYVIDVDGNISNSVIVIFRNDGNFFGFEVVGLNGVYFVGGEI